MFSLANSVKFQKNLFLVLCLFQNTLKPKSSTCCSVRMLVELLNLERIEKLLLALQFVPGNVRNNLTTVEKLGNVQALHMFYFMYKCIAVKFLNISSSTNILKWTHWSSFTTTKGSTDYSEAKAWLKPCNSTFTFQ